MDTNESEPGPAMLQFGSVEVDLPARAVRRVDGTARLSEREVEVLRYLADRAGEVVTRERLERDVWQMRAGARSEAVPVAIRRLRGKIEPEPRNPSFLLTVQLRGWRLRVPRPPASVLPGFATPYLPRPAHEDAVRAWLAGGHRLVTLMGPPGAGKARLAVAVATSFASALYVDLEGCTEPGMIEVALAAAVGAGTPTGDEIARGLAGWELVVLDHADPRVDEVVTLAIARAPQVCFLATAPAPLGIVGEVVHRVSELEVEEAASLLSARLAAASGTPVAGDSLLQLVEGLDRLPRALERWAATNPVAGVDPGLDARQRALLADCCVFPAEFDPETAAQLFDASIDDLDALCRRSLLVRRSARLRVPAEVRRQLETRPEAVAAHAAWVGAEVHRLHPDWVTRPVETAARAVQLRGDLEFVLAGADRVQAARAALFISRWSRFEGCPPDASVALASVLDAPGVDERTRARIRLSAATHALDGGDRALAERMIAGLEAPLPWPDLELTHRIQLATLALHAGEAERARSLIAGTPHTTEELPPDLRVHLWRMLAMVDAFQGEMAAADTCLVESLALARAANCVAVLPNLLGFRGVVLANLGQVEASRALLDEAVALALATRQWTLAAEALGNLFGLWVADDPARAAAYVARAAELPLPGILHTMTMLKLGFTRSLAGDLKGAVEAIEVGLSGIQSLPAGWSNQATLLAALVLAEVGRAAEAAALLTSVEPGRPDAGGIGGVPPEELDVLVRLVRARIAGEPDEGVLAGVQPDPEHTDVLRALLARSGQRVDL